MTLQLILQQTPGMERTVTYEQLRELPHELQIDDISSLFPGRSGMGIRFGPFVRQILEYQGPLGNVELHASADQFCKVIAWDQIESQAILVYEQQGQPLPQSAGGPFRLLVPGTVLCGTGTLDNCVNVKHLDRVVLDSSPETPV
ncbi:MAG: molybdopterin-dependent oxidoreductase [Planctomycetaceae bacterium]|nr:molybdopterin-dependent oxidoreductase [Planctomycetaceae bacterium]